MDKSATQPELIVPHFELIRELRKLYPPLPFQPERVHLGVRAHLLGEELQLWR
jgi:hypothetical protein